MAKITIPIVALAAALVGCAERPDERLHKLARESLAQQARQNEQLAQQGRQLAEAARRLVAADSQARQEMLAAHAALQEKLQAERAGIEQQLASLEEERRELAQQRGRDPIVAQSIGAVGATIACLLPLLLAGYVLFTVNRPGDHETALNEALVAEFVAEQPLLPSPIGVPQLEHQTVSGRRGRQRKLPSA